MLPVEGKARGLSKHRHFHKHSPLLVQTRICRLQKGLCGVSVAAQSQNSIVLAGGKALEQCALSIRWQPLLVEVSLVVCGLPCAAIPDLRMRTSESKTFSVTIP